jgi:hypothetical protein
MGKPASGKLCNNCGINTAHPNSKYQLCSDCSSLRSKEKIREYQAHRRALDRERVLEEKRIEYRKNIHRVRAYYLANRDRILANNKQWHKNNKARNTERKR